LPSYADNKSRRQNFKRNAKKFVLIADQLHKKGEGQSLHILWEHELESVLKSLHENDWAHYPKDQHKFRAKVAQRFYVPQMVEVCNECISSCSECQNEKAGLRARTDCEMNPPPPTSPFFRVHLDLTRPFVAKNKKKKYIMAAIDFSTKFASTHILPNKKPQSVANAFSREILERHGCPFEIVTDQGSEFNAEFAELLKQSGLKHVKVSTRNPKANGQVERFMRILKSTLCAT
jgi:transposase InsO family protein